MAAVAIHLLRRGSQAGEPRRSTFQRPNSPLPIPHGDAIMIAVSSADLYLRSQGKHTPQSREELQKTGKPAVSIPLSEISERIHLTDSDPKRQNSLSSIRNQNPRPNTQMQKLGVQ
jgi:hypothetical protein